MFSTVGADPTSTASPSTTVGSAPPQKDPNRHQGLRRRSAGRAIRQRGRRQVRPRRKVPDVPPDAGGAGSRTSTAKRATSRRARRPADAAGCYWPTSSSSSAATSPPADEVSPGPRPADYAEQNENKSFAAGPPTLTHEGEKVQPVWLFQFLTNPIPIRPMAVLQDAEVQHERPTTPRHWSTTSRRPARSPTPASA